MLRVLIILLLSALAACAQQYRAFWADAFHEGYKTPAEVDALVSNLSAAKANAIFVQMRRRADAYCRLCREPFAEDATVPHGFDPLDDLIRKARPLNIEVHAWFVVYPGWPFATPPKDPNHLYWTHLAGAPPAEQWNNYTSAGARGTGLDPGHPGVLPYLAGTFLDIFNHYDVAGIHLDYIRYPEDADYGYSPAAVERFNRHLGRSGFPARTDAAWSQWRRDQVTALVRQLYLRLQQVRPQAKLSTAVITWGNGPASDAGFRTLDAYARVFQDWRGWLEEGIVDFTMPMNYFRDSQFPQYLDRWSEFQKDRQYGRGYVNGLGNYLNTQAQTLAQLERVLRPSAQGNTPLGFVLYSYASTTSDNTAQRPERAFYETLGGMVAATPEVPELAWKARPSRGHLAGRVAIEGAPSQWRDFLPIELMGTDGFALSLRTDSSGFFGAVDLVPGQYTAGLFADRTLVAVSQPVVIEAGRVGEIQFNLDPGRLAPFIPALDEAVTEAAPGDVIRLTGRSLAREASWAEAVPLPRQLAGLAIDVNGLAAPLLEAGPGFVGLQLPYTADAQFILRARRGGLESAPLRIAAVEARPRILSARIEGDALEIVATGLGATDPPALSGSGGSDSEPFQQCVLPIRVLLVSTTGETEITPALAVLAPWIPGRYRVQAALPAGLVPTQVRLKAGSAISPEFGL
ncbi:MAG: family 10 glycosylhydrolase [Bryobacter sp.]|nr:family 10 glycosylhydrolase [Bryobacter sp.]